MFQGSVFIQGTSCGPSRKCFLQETLPQNNRRPRGTVSLIILAKYLSNIMPDLLEFNLNWCFYIQLDFQSASSVVPKLDYFIYYPHSSVKFFQLGHLGENRSRSQLAVISVSRPLQTIDTNWRCGRHVLHRIYCRSENSKGVYCLQYDDHKIVSGLRDNTIKVRNSC